MSLRNIWRHHGTKILGYAQVLAGAIAIMDQQLVNDVLGPHALRWALFASGILTALRGHGNTARIKEQQREGTAL